MSSRSIQSGWSNVTRSSTIANKPNFGGVKEKGKEEETVEDTTVRMLLHPFNI